MTSRKRAINYEEINKYKDFEDPTKNDINENLSKYVVSLQTGGKFGCVWLLDGIALRTSSDLVKMGVPKKAINVSEINLENYTLMQPEASRLGIKLHLGPIEVEIATLSSNHISLVYLDFTGYYMDAFHKTMRTLSEATVQANPFIIALTVSTRFRDNSSFYTSKFPKTSKSKKWNVDLFQQQITNFLQKEYFEEASVQQQRCYCYQRQNDDGSRSQSMLHLVYLINWAEIVETEYRIAEIHPKLRLGEDCIPPQLPGRLYKAVKYAGFMKTSSGKENWHWVLADYLSPSQPKKRRTSEDLVGQTVFATGCLFKRGGVDVEKDYEGVVIKRVGDRCEVEFVEDSSRFMMKVTDLIIKY